MAVDPSLKIEKNLEYPQRWNRYAYTQSNPLKFLDPDGKDAITSVDRGNRSVSITVNVVMTGPGASPAAAAQYQSQANASWGGPRSFTASNGQTWSMSVQTNVTTNPGQFTSADNPNTITASNSGMTEMTSNNAGTLNSSDLSREGGAGHEVGHMMGLDHPADNVCAPGIMDPAAENAQPAQQELNQLGQNAIASTEVTKAPQPQVKEKQP
jgi:hypothetical protein